jgi:transcriptional regulator with XRE-family HTH domain
MTAGQSKKRTTFGARICEARTKKLGWTQVELGTRVNVTGNYIAQLERDERPPSDILITRLANALGMTRDELGTPEPRKGDNVEYKKYPARKPLLDDDEFLDAPEPVRQHVLSWPDAGAEWTTRQWYELFSRSLDLHKEGKLDPRKDSSAKPARPRKG